MEILEVNASDLLRDYWLLMPVAIVFDALVLGGMSYGVWRGMRRYVTGRRGDVESKTPPRP